MKNAFVLEHHLGDDGTVTEGMILRDVPQKRFDALEKRGLVREATAEEVEKGYRAPFEPSGARSADEDLDGDDDQDGDDDAGDQDGADNASAGQKQARQPRNKRAPDAENK